MLVLGKPAAVVAAGLVILAVGPVSASIAAPRAAKPRRPAQAAHPAASGQEASAPSATGAYVDLTFEVKNLSDQGLLVKYNPAGVVSDLGGIAMARSGAMNAVYLGGLVVLLGVPARTRLDATATSMLRVDGAELTGTATVPAGATVTVTNGDTGQTIDLHSGPFSFATGLAGNRGHQVIFSPAVAPGEAITGPAEPGRPVRLQRDAGSAAQVWEITHPRNRSRTEIINKRTGLCLDAVRHAAGAKLITVICNGSRHQQWTQRRQANGTWRLSQGSSGPVLQAASAGTRVRLAPRTSPGQHRNWLRRRPR
jgi:uncharacterized protein YdbL (DUF1318 family)